METDNRQAELQEQPAALRSWVAPTLECLPLNEALLGGDGVYDGIYMGS